MSEKENRKTYDTWDDKIPREGLKFSERNVVWKVYNADFPYGGNEFMVSDIITIKKDIKDIAEKEIRIVNIYACGDTEEKSEAIKNICDHYKDDNYIICTAAYVPARIWLDEFPDDIYDYLCNKLPAENDIDIPYKEVLERELKMLEGLGFVNINNIVQYGRVAYIYSNTLGKKIVDYIKDHKIIKC